MPDTPPMSRHHHFEPTHYHHTIGSHEPVLRVASGDRITTTTVDAWGQDAQRQPATRRGNPMTGPFFIEDAQPDDVVAVTIEAIVPSRRYGFSRISTAPNVVDPMYVSQLPPSEIAEWDVDLGAQTIRLISPQKPRLSELVLPLEPMLGCFGVAPPRGQAISTATSGEWGGNMDYRQFGNTATIYFPVFEPGALFHLGDAHAVQGDGEICGTGIEISTTTTFRVDLIKGWKIGWPRFKRDDWFGTVGNARPLDQALQHATTEMLRWLLEEPTGLDPVAAHIFLQQTVRYDLGNVFDPAYTMICKLAGDVLKRSGIELPIPV
jgi:amidase